jgi:hypothetical protein
MLVQGVLRQDPFSGHLFVFRGRKANLLKIVFWDGTGLCLFTKRLEHGVLLWPSNVDPGGTLPLTSAQLSSLIDGIGLTTRLFIHSGFAESAGEAIEGRLHDVLEKRTLSGLDVNVGRHAGCRDEFRHALENLVLV